MSVATKQELQNYVLGFDLGPSSIGWAAIKLNDRGKPDSILDAGIRRLRISFAPIIDSLIIHPYIMSDN